MTLTIVAGELVPRVLSGGQAASQYIMLHRASQHIAGWLGAFSLGQQRQQIQEANGRSAENTRARWAPHGAHAPHSGDGETEALRQPSPTWLTQQISDSAPLLPFFEVASLLLPQLVLVSGSRGVALRLPSSCPLPQHSPPLALLPGEGRIECWIEA